MLKPPCHWRAAPMTGSTRRCAHPDRFAAFAALPTADPKAADELERTVGRLGFKGAIVNGLTKGVFLDDKRFWPIFERAQTLDVPLYMHLAIPHPAVIDAYYNDNVEKHPGILRAGRGFTVETATQGIRLVLSGVFDAYPRLKIIIGHLGEGLPSTSGASATGCAAATAANRSVTPFASTFMSPPAGSFPIRLCCAA